MDLDPTITTDTGQDKSESKKPQRALQSFDSKRFERLANARDYDTNQWYKQRTSRWNAEIISSPLRRRHRRQNPNKTFASPHNENPSLLRSSTSRNTTTRSNAAMVLEDAHDIPTTFTKDNHFHFEEVLQKLESYNRTLTRTASLTSNKNKQQQQQDKNALLEKKNKDPYAIVRNFENYKQSVQQEQQSEQQQQQSEQSKTKPILQVPSTYRRQRTSPSLLEHADTKDLLGELSLLARRHSAPLDEYDVNGADMDTDDNTTFSSLSTKNPFFTKPQYYKDDAGYYPSNVSRTPTSSAYKNKTPQTTTYHEQQQPQTQKSSSWILPSWKTKWLWQGEHQDKKRDNRNNSHNDIRSRTPSTVQETPESMNDYNNNNGYSYGQRNGHEKNLSGTMLFGNDDEWSERNDTLADDDNDNPNNTDNYLLQLSQLMFGYDHDVVRRYQTTHTNHHDTHDLVHQDDDDDKSTLLEKQTTTILEEEEEVSITNSTVSSLEYNTTNVNVTTARHHRRRRHSNAKQPKEQRLLVLVQQKRTRRRTWICIVLLVVSNTILFTMLKHDQMNMTSLPFVVTKYTAPKTTLMQKYYTKYIRNNAWRKNMMDKQYHQLLLQQSQRLVVDPFSKILHQTKANLHVRIQCQLWQQKVFHWIQKQQPHNWTTMTHTFVLPHTRYLYRYFYLFQSKDNSTTNDYDNTIHNKQEESENVVSNFSTHNKDEDDDVVHNEDDKDSPTKQPHHQQQIKVVEEQADRHNSQESTRLFSARKKKKTSQRISPSRNDKSDVDDRVVAKAFPQVPSTQENSHGNAATLGSSSSSLTKTRATELKEDSGDVDNSKTTTSSKEELSSFKTGGTAKDASTVDGSTKIPPKTKDHVQNVPKAKLIQIPTGSASNKKTENKKEMDLNLSTSSSSVSSNTTKTNAKIIKGAISNLNNQTSQPIEEAVHQMPQSDQDASGGEKEDVHHNEDLMLSEEPEPELESESESKSDSESESSNTTKTNAKIMNVAISNLKNQTSQPIEEAVHQMPQSDQDDSGGDKEDVHHNDDLMPSEEPELESESESEESSLATPKSDESPEPSTTKDGTKHAQNLVSTRRTASKEQMAEVNTNNNDSSTSTTINTKESLSFQEERAHGIDRKSTDEIEQRQGVQPSAMQKLHSNSLREKNNIPIRVIRPISIDKEFYNKAEKPISIANLVRFGNDLQSDLMQSIQERMDHIRSKIFSSDGPATPALSTRRVTRRYQVFKPLANFVSTSHNLQIDTASRRSGSDELLLRYMQLIAFQLACFHADMHPNMTAYVGGVYCKSIFKRCKKQPHNQAARVSNRLKSTAPMVGWSKTESIMNVPHGDGDEDAFLRVPLIEIVGDWFKERRRKKQMKKKSSKHRKHR